MLQKTQWTVAGLLAVGALLAAGARPAEAQVRLRLTGPVTTQLRTGIVLPPGSPQPSGIIIPPSNPTPPAYTPPPPAPVVNTPAPPPPAPVVTTPRPAPVVTPPPVQNYQPAPSYQPAPIGFSTGPSLLGVPRLPLGRAVNRVGPDINGDGWSDISKDRRSK